MGSFGENRKKLFFCFCRPILDIFGFPLLRIYDRDSEDNVDKKMILYFTYESRGILKSFTLCITIKAIVKPNLRHIDKFN